MSEIEEDETRRMKPWEFVADIEDLGIFAPGTATIVIGLMALGHQVVEYWQLGERLIAAAIVAAVISLCVAGIVLIRSWRDFLRITLILLLCLGGFAYLLARLGYAMPVG